jgi:PEP-CTERM motif
MRIITHLFPGFVALLFASSQLAHAASITAAGSQLNLGDGWRDSSVAKTQDIDGDNIYGSLGYFMFSTQTPGSGSGVSPGPGAGILSLPSYIFLTLNGADTGFHSDDYTLINDPNNPGSANDLSSGISSKSGPLADNTEFSLIDINFSAGVSSTDTIRVGIFVDNTIPLDTSPIGLRLEGAGGDSLNVAKAQASRANDYYFFDLTGLNPGDVITVFATTGVSPSAVAVGGFTFDSVPESVPEPSAMILAGFGFVFLAILFTRRSTVPPVS